VAKEPTVIRKDYWSMSNEDVYRALGTDERGLSEREAQRRLEAYGRNELPGQAFSRIQVLLRQFKNPIFAILIACAIIAGLFAEFEQSIAILSMIALSVILGFYNEYRAEKIVEDLRQAVSFKAVVIRDGKSSEIDASSIVPGDLVSIYVGDIVPADIKIVESKNLQVNEATFTGESFPAEKNSDVIDLQKTNSTAVVQLPLHGHRGGSWERAWCGHLDGEEHGTWVHIQKLDSIPSRDRVSGGR